MEFLQIYDIKNQKGGPSVEQSKKITPVYASSVNVNIKALVNAIGHQRAYYAVNTVGHLEYRDENDIFGKSSVLHTNAILLYLYLHFLQPSASANVLIDVKEAADYLGRPVRTIVNNLRILRKKGYINFEPGFIEDTHDVFIEYYSDNGLTSYQGGTGYIVIDKTVMDRLISIKRINTLRFILRSLLSSVPGKQNIGLNDGCTMSELRRIFPTYTQRKDVIAILNDETVNKLLHIRFGRTLNYLKVRIADKFDSLAIKTKQLAETRRKLKELFTSLDLKYPENKFAPSRAELYHISNITLNYPMETLMRAIKQVYVNRNRSDIKNLSAYLYTATQRLLT